MRRPPHEARIFENGLQVIAQDFTFASFTVDGVKYFFLLLVTTLIGLMGGLCRRSDVSGRLVAAEARVRAHGSLVGFMGDIVALE
jgi:hypothetical protein